MAQMGRVTRPGGRILLLEQGYSDRPWLRTLQDKRARRQFEMFGCRWDREPHQQAMAAGLVVERDDRHYLGCVHALHLRPPAHG